jgi:hypothetical protein
MCGTARDLRTATCADAAIAAMIRIILEAQLGDKQVVMSHYDGLRRGRAGDAPLVMKVGRNRVFHSLELPAKSLCFNSKHRTREPLDKFFEYKFRNSKYKSVTTSVSGSVLQQYFTAIPVGRYTAVSWTLPYNCIYSS